MKYIRHADLGFILFGITIAHFDMACWLRIDHEEILSAGFVNQDELNPLCCHGRSKTLKKCALDGDTELLKKQLKHT